MKALNSASDKMIRFRSSTFALLRHTNAGSGIFGDYFVAPEVGQHRTDVDLHVLDGSPSEPMREGNVERLPHVAGADFGRRDASKLGNGGG
jgi:hypothetical protein